MAKSKIVETKKKVKVVKDEEEDQNKPHTHDNWEDDYFFDTPWDQFHPNK